MSENYVRRFEELSGFSIPISSWLTGDDSSEEIRLRFSLLDVRGCSFPANFQPEMFPVAF